MPIFPTPTLRAPMQMEHGWGGGLAPRRRLSIIGVIAWIVAVSGFVFLIHEAFVRLS